MAGNNIGGVRFWVGDEIYFEGSDYNEISNGAGATFSATGIDVHVSPIGIPALGGTKDFWKTLMARNGRERARRYRLVCRGFLDTGIGVSGFGNVRMYACI